MLGRDWYQPTLCIFFSFQEDEDLDPLLQILSQLRNIKALLLHQCSHDEHDLEGCLAAWPRLEQLSIPVTLSPECMRILSALPRFRYLHVCGITCPAMLAEPFPFISLTLTQVRRITHMTPLLHMLADALLEAGPGRAPMAAINGQLQSVQVGQDFCFVFCMG